MTALPPTVEPDRDNARAGSQRPPAVLIPQPDEEGSMNASHFALSRRHVLAGLGAAALTAGLGRIARAESTKASLALDWYPNADHAGLFLAQASGYFASAGLDLDIYTPADPTTVLQTVGAGRDTFGISYQTDVLLARAAGVPVVSIAALVQHPLVVIMSLAEKGISRPKDLVGKTVGYPGIPSQEAYLATMLETDGASATDVSLINVDFNLLPAMLSGQVDAVMGAFRNVEVVIAEQEGHAVNAMPVEQWGVPDYYELVLVASEETVAKRADLATAFLGAVQHGFDDAIANPGAALDVLAKASAELDKTVTQKGIELLIPDWKSASPAFGAQDPARWKDYGAWMASRHLIPASLDVSDAFTTKLLPLPAGTPVSSPVSGG
jgi:putative hydroxymethylpyrimidine transport system substrate-binding protein